MPGVLQISKGSLPRGICSLEKGKTNYASKAVQPNTSGWSSPVENLCMYMKCIIWFWKRTKPFRKVRINAKPRFSVPVFGWGENSIYLYIIFFGSSCRRWGRDADWAGRSGTWALPQTHEVKARLIGGHPTVNGLVGDPLESFEDDSWDGRQWGGHGLAQGWAGHTWHWMSVLGSILAALFTWNTL